jgi:SPP1 gp7 family putative phage head morphogenesis protein
MAKANPNEKQIEYWKNRTEKEFLAGEKEGLQLAKALQKNYQECYKQIEKEINAFYGKYAINNQISLQDAKKLLNKSELKSFKSQLDDIIKYFKGNNQDVSQLKLLRAKLKVSRLEELKTNINYELVKLSNGVNEQLQDYFKDTYEDQYYQIIFDVNQNIGFSTSFTQPSTKIIEKTISKNYNLGNYSINGENATWKNTKYLSAILDQKIPQGLTLGYNPNKLAKIVDNQLNTGYNATVRLIRTEYNAIMNEATADGYKECGIERYQILATLDDRTSEICQEMDLEIFDLKDKQVGVNYPPFHPNCRSTTIPYFEPDEFDTEEVRIARDNKGQTYMIPSSVNYKEWKAGLVEQKDGTLRYKNK